MFEFVIGYVIGKHLRAIIVLGTIGILWQNYQKPSEPIPTPAQPMQVQSQ